RTLFHVDAVQAAGKLSLNPRQFGIDLMSVSAHKLHGPKGAGVLVVREGLRITPLLHGGGQQQGLRSGTENVPLIVGMAKAIRMANDQRSAHTAHMRRLRALLCERLAAGDTESRITL